MLPSQKKSCEKIWISKKEPYLYTINETEKQKSKTMNNLRNILSAAAIAERQRLTVNLVQSETHRNDHSAALVWVASFVCKTTTDGERWMKADAIINELMQLRRLQRSFGYMTDDLLARRQRATNNLRAIVIEEGGANLWDTFNREL